LSSRFNRILKKAREEKVYRASGKLNVPRLSGNRLTCKVFDKNKETGNRHDTAVFALIDESGSMCGYKINNTRIAAIGLAETFAKCNIPLYIMGFTADERGYDVIHNHYMKWKNTQADRLKLLSINARSNNFDGYSIRQATEILKKRAEEHKMLIVISDGQPLCNAYARTNTGISNIGIADTKAAVKDAMKDVTVIGILIGNESPEIHKELYGYNFLYIENINDMFLKLGVQIQKFIKGW
jgi:cobalamin biosynthesis protein CobT